MGLDSDEENLEQNWRYKLETKFTGSGPKESNRKRGQDSSWTVQLAEEEEGKVKLSLCLTN
jgi:adenine C2-methylase RlmN of 23S rRNA A2503 and tRNA A37